MTVWWKRGVIYQIYPRSFQDTNGDGIGDLKGISARLDYLTWLGIDAIWISPIYPSPMADFGYDVSDYCNIDPLFGSLDDFDELVTSAHAYGISRSSSISFPITHPIAIRGFLRAGPRAQIRNGTGTSGATARLTDLLPIIGYRNSAGRPGPSMRQPGNIICTASFASSPISIGAIQRCAPRCMT